MRQRPQPSTRRGLIRAALVIICLAALLLAALLAVSSLTAPTVKAPVPPTLAPRPTATPPVIQIKPTPQQSRPGATPHATHRDIASRSLSTLPSDSATQFYVAAPAGSDASMVRSAAAAPHGSGVIYYGGHGDAYARSPLFYRQSRRHPMLIGTGDALVRPAWSADGHFVLYERVQATRTLPRARWSTYQYDFILRRTRRLLSIDALNVSPLGWIDKKPVVLVANGTDTSIYEARPGHARLLALVMAQPFTSASLSPDGQYIAVAAPTNCFFCTLDVLNIRTMQMWSGPTGLPSENDVAWTANGRYVGALVQNRVVISTPQGHEVATYLAPPRLPRKWSHVFMLQVGNDWFGLTDTVTHQTYSGNRTVRTGV